MEELEKIFDDYTSYDELSELDDSIEDEVENDEELEISQDFDDNFYRSLEDY